MGSAVVREWVGVIAGCKPGTCGVGAQADRPPVGPTVAGPGFGMGSGAGTLSGLCAECPWLASRREH